MTVEMTIETIENAYKLNAYKLYIASIIFCGVWWLSNLVLVYVEEPWHHLRRCRRLTRRTAKVLFLAKKKREFSVWGIYQQLYVYALIPVIIGCWVSGVIIPLKLLGALTAGAFLVFTFCTCIDRAFFDTKGEREYWENRPRY